MLTGEQIALAKSQTQYIDDNQFHEHDDCIRIAYEWLDAQVKLTAPNRRKTRPLKHIIEKWAGRYVSQSDVEVAAHMHPEIFGQYPYFNISAKLVQPNARRLAAIPEAGTQQYEDQNPRRTYSASEP